MTRAAAARPARAWEVASPDFRAAIEGRRQYGNAAQSQCNTRGFAGGPGAPPTATFDEDSRRGARISGPIRSHAAAPLSQSGAAAIPEGGEGVGKVSSQKSRKRKFASVSQSEAGEHTVRESARALWPIRGKNWKDSSFFFFFFFPVAQSSGCPVVARRGRASQLSGQS